MQRYKANSSPHRNLHDCWIHIKLWKCSRVNTSWWGEFTDCNESRRNTIEYAWHSPKPKLSFRSLSINRGDGRHCREEDYGAKSLFFISHSPDIMCLWILPSEAKQASRGPLSDLFFPEFKVCFSTAHQKYFFHAPMQLHKPSNLG